ncbi:hypothetical protein PCK1_003176, partial [Pneumocystis canis]
MQVLKKRDQAVAGKVDGIGEEHLLALILKENGLEEDQCKSDLKTYCKSLNDANLKSEDIHDKLKGYCKDGGEANEGKCKTLKQEVEKKCEKLKTALKTALENKPFSETDCEKHEPQCLFLEGADPTNLKEPCSNLRTKCYELRRRRVRDKVLMRALKGELKEGGNENCKTALKEHCVKLAPMSPDLMQACLLVDGTCTQLAIQAQGKCTSLKKDVDEALPKLEKNDTQSCHSLLEKCHFYGPNCNDKEKPECEKLTSECEKHDVEYMPPEGPFIPIDPTVTVLDKVGLDALYKEAAKEGVLIERLSELTTENLLLFMYQKADGDFDDKTCKEAVKDDKCDYLKTLTGEKDDKYDCEAKCDELNGKLTTNRDSLKNSIKGKHYLFGRNNNADSKLLGWHEMQPTIVSDYCAELESQCFYLDRHSKSNELKIICQNVRAMCYKRGLNDVAYEELESQMRGYFVDYSGDDWLNKCQKNLTE